VLDLVAQLGRNVVHVGDAHPSRILQRDTDDLLVRPLLVGHVEDADDAPADSAARERRLADEDQGVQRIAVAAHRPLDEAVVRGIGHRGEEAPVEDDGVEILVQLVLVPRPRRNLDEDDDVLGGGWCHPSDLMRSTRSSKNASTSISTPT
jgi:hypothetical protein